MFNVGLLTSCTAVLPVLSNSEYVVSPSSSALSEPPLMYELVDVVSVPAVPATPGMTTPLLLVSAPIVPEPSSVPPKLVRFNVVVPSTVIVPANSCQSAALAPLRMSVPVRYLSRMSELLSFRPANDSVDPESTLKCVLCVITIVSLNATVELVPTETSPSTVRLLVVNV